MNILPVYTFVPGIAGTGTITVPGAYALEDFHHIFNVTRGALLFDPKVDDAGGTVVVTGGSTTITLAYGTQFCNANDRLQILVYTPVGGSNFDGGGTSSGPAGLYDAFGRQRVSQGYTLADYKSVYGVDQDLLTDNVGAGSSVAANTNQASIRLTSGLATSSRAAVQSRMYHTYQPGKSQKIQVSFVFGPAVANSFQEAGYFDGRNGIFIRYNGTTGLLSLVQRTYVSGSVQEVEVLQSNWNQDKCNGTDSDFAIDKTKDQLMIVDLQWLGVGMIRVGFAFKDRLVYAHNFYHANLINTAYWSQPSLPIRAQVRVSSDAAAASAPYMDLICSAVEAEGGYAEAGFDYAQASAIRVVGDLNATLPVFAIRLKNTLGGYPNRITVRPTSLTAISPVTGVLLRLIRLNSHTSISGGNWLDLGSQSGVEYNATATGYTADPLDHVIDSFFVPAGQGNNAPGQGNVANPSASKRGYIAQNVDSNNSQAFLLLATSLGTNATAGAGIQWREVL